LSLQDKGIEVTLYQSQRDDILVKLNPLLMAKSQRDDMLRKSFSSLPLSQNRANAVKNGLVQRGIDKDRIIAKGYGETKPVASNTTEAVKQKNRRTEVRILEE
jgi:hypothetical protein